MNIKGRLGGRGLREQQLKHVCAETEGGSGSQAAESRTVGWGDIYTQILMQKVSFPALESSKHLLFPFCSFLATAGPSSVFLGLGRHSHLAIA